MIVIASDHGGYALKQELMAHLKEKGVEFEDIGTYSEASCNYPEYAERAARGVAEGKYEKGILVCGTGIGISLAANRVHGIRAAVCSESYSAELTRRHNDANMIAFGARVVGESHIFNAKKQQDCRIHHISLVPEHPKALPDALHAISEADLILLGPGSLYTSVIPNLLVDGVADTIRASHAQKFYICNIMTQDGETEGYTAADHLEALQRHGREGIVDLCLANNAPIPRGLAARYSEEDAELLRVDRERIAELGIALAEYPLLSAQGGYARHDPALLAQAVMELYRERTVRIYRGTQQYITEEQEWK